MYRPPGRHKDFIKEFAAIDILSSGGTPIETADRSITEGPACSTGIHAMRT